MANRGWRVPSRVRIAKYARGTDYHRTLTARLEQLALWLRDRGATITRTFTDSGTGARARAGGARRPGVDRQEHHADPAGRWLVFPDRQHSYRSRVRRRRHPFKRRWIRDGGPGFLRVLHPLPRCLSDRGPGGGSGARRDPMPFLPHHRIEGADARDRGRAHARLGLRLRHLQRRLSLEPAVRPSRPGAPNTGSGNRSLPGIPISSTA